MDSQFLDITSLGQGVLKKSEDQGLKKVGNLRKKRTGTGMVSRALLKEASEILPHLPDSENIEIIREYIKSNLKLNSEESRKRYTHYILIYLFPSGIADRALRIFARNFAGQQSLRDVCFYRFSKTYPLTLNVFENVIAPHIDAGSMDKEECYKYLRTKFPEVKAIKDGARGILEAWVGAQILKSNRTKLIFSYREISIPALAFIIHSEFPNPGIYNMANIENNKFIQALLWDPKKAITAMYELRNRGIIAKISEIDQIRQFSTSLTLEDVNEKLKKK